MEHQFNLKLQIIVYCNGRVCTKLSYSHFYICLKMCLVQYFDSAVFQIYRSSFLPPLHASTYIFSVSVVNCLGFKVKVICVIVEGV